MNSIEQTELVFLLLLTFVIGFGSVARVLKLSYPIVLVFAGLLLSFIPRLPRISLSPDLIFLGVLPPLLFSAAFQTSWRDFRYHFVSILLLAFGLVAFTVVGVSAMAHFLLPWFDWRLGLVLGAVVAPTDAIAATAIAKRIQLPQRIIDILEGESLINDASGLLALEFTTALVVSGMTPSFSGGLWRLFYLVCGGILIGLIVGKLVYEFERRIDDSPIEITLSLLVPYVAYIGAESIHCSGVLAAVSAGLFLGNRRSDYSSSAVRLESRAFWNTITFVLNGLVFLLIGLQLPFILHEIHNFSLRELIVDALEFVIAVILLRLIWVYPGAYAANLIRRFIQKQPVPIADPREVFVIGWTGMRGVISLAAAIALPTELADGSPFPQRSMIIFLTFCVIFTTLVLQGLSLPWLIRTLGLVRLSDAGSGDRQARKLVFEAALQHLAIMRATDQPAFKDLYDSLALQYSRRLEALSDHLPGDPDVEQAITAQHRYRSITRELRTIERSKASELRSSGVISDLTFRHIERELDLLDVRYA